MFKPVASRISANPNGEPLSMRPCISRIFGLVILAIGLTRPEPVWPQGRIDPALPPAPLDRARIMFLFPAVKTVRDPQAVVPPLTTKQKYLVFVHRTTDISLPLEALTLAAGSQWLNYSPRYGQGWAAFGKRFGAYAGGLASSSFFTDAFLPSL